MREVVVGPAADATRGVLGPGLADDLRALLAGQLLPVGVAQVEVTENGGRVVGHQGGDLCVLGFELVHQDLLAGHRPTELLDVLGVHAGEPVVLVEPGVTERCDADHAGGSHDPVGQACRAREGVRSAAGAARDAEALEAEVVGERGHVVDLVDDAPAGPPGRPAVPGPVVRDEKDPRAAVDVLVRPALEPTARRSVQEEHREFPPGSPQSAYASVRPSGVSNVSSGSPTGEAEHTPDELKPARPASATIASIGCVASSSCVHVARSSGSTSARSLEDPLALLGRLAERVRRRGRRCAPGAPRPARSASTMASNRGRRTDPGSRRCPDTNSVVSRSLVEQLRRRAPRSRRSRRPRPTTRSRARRLSRRWRSRASQAPPGRSTSPCRTCP